jgi:hypothetical protein
LLLGRKVAAMPSSPGTRYDFFLSRRGSVAAIAQEVTDVLKENGYRLFTQDYDIAITANFIEGMHEVLDAILMRDKPATVTQASVGRAAVQGMGGVGNELSSFESKRRGDGVTASTIRRDLACLSSLLTSCVDWEYADSNPIPAYLRRRAKRGLKEGAPRTR